MKNPREANFIINHHNSNPQSSSLHISIKPPNPQPQQPCPFSKPHSTDTRRSHCPKLQHPWQRPPPHPRPPSHSFLNPIRSLHEHTREVQSVDYNPVRRDSFISSSWDDSIKLWTLDRPTSIRSFQEHAYCVYAAVWNPRHADVFASASGDCTLRVWDVREPGSTMVVAAHEFEILSCDWNKYDDCVITTASVDKSVRVWDISF